jgi:SAM-dependent methyltransferase
MPAWVAFACPFCHGALEQSAPDELLCVDEGLSFSRMDGIWRFLSVEQTEHYKQFMFEYETVRLAEGRGPREAAYYRALPYHDLSARMSADWRIRARSFDALIMQVVRPLEQPGRRLAVLDLGAGNGWLSHRLALRGHRVAAVDLLDNDFDGLACLKYYEYGTVLPHDAGFTPVQAEFDQLPFPAGGADLVIFNASLHYSVNIRATLAEALRVLAEDGMLVVLDSPVYQDAGSGQKMVREREARFKERFGFPSNAMPSENFLTYSFLKTLETQLAISWQLITPFYGLGWLLRPLKAALRASREPAKFHIIVGTKAS